MAQYSTASPSVGHNTPTSQGQQRPSQPPTSAGPAATTSTETGSNEPQHKRVYQACIPCRRRKVKCDLGSVDNPHDPPCVRCRRESKECFFSATRRKRKTDDDGDVSEGDEYIIRNGRKRLNAAVTPPRELDRRLYSEVPLTPGGSQGRSQPLRRPDDLSRQNSGRRDSDQDFPPETGDANQQLENVEAQTVMRRGLYGPHDALDLLYKAATDRSVAGEMMMSAEKSTATNEGVLSPSTTSNVQQQQAQQHQRHGSTTMSSIERGGAGGGNTASAGMGGVQHQPLNRTDSNGARVKREGGRSSISNPRAAPPLPRTNGPQQQQDQQPIDPSLESADPASQPGYVEALKAWQRFRFVRAGWFTPQEAIEYIDYYYKYLSPMTPISPPTFSNPASHVTLLQDEPILSVTLLTIASRYKQLEGPGGHCRSYAIHEQLWTYLRGMIERCLWGQEAFGSGFCGSGSSSMIEEASQTSSTAPWRGMRKGSLRTLGTIDSLMILTEWHPRALHFPPQDATDELMLPSFDAPLPGEGEDDDGSKNLGGGVGGKRIESWLEPAWRSDRMCWMLLSTALGLAFELGVFDDIDEMLKDDAMTRPEFQDEVYRHRSNRIKRLLLVYSTQLAGRLGWTSMAPESVRRNDPAFAKKRPFAADEPTPGTNISSLSNGFNYIPDMELDDQIIHCWAGISNAMHLGNEKLFRSRKHTQEIIQSGKYVSLLGDFGPMLRDWYREFELFRLPPFIRCILKIEYEYVRIYVNSLSLQAVVERCTSNAGATAAAAAGNHSVNGQTDGNETEGADAAADGQTNGAPPQLSPQTILNYGKLPLGQLGGFTVNDQEYVREVVDGSRSLLNEVVTGLLPMGYLKHAPVRTYFRIISGAMFLLKTFALGAPRSDVKASIDLMDATVEALRNCVVDDVHLGIRFADLLESLTSRLRNRFIQAPTLQQATNSGRGGSPVGGVQGQNGGDWVGNHAQSLRDGLDGPFTSPTLEAANISATPFDLNSAAFPYPGGASLGPSTPAAALDFHNASSLNHNSNALNINPATTNNGSASNNNAAINGNGGGNNNNNSSHPGSASHSLPPPGAGMDATLFDEWNNPGNEMWYLPTGPAFFQNMGVGGDSNVAMTSEGVNVGGLDLLEYMAMDPAQFGSGMDGHGF